MHFVFLLHYLVDGTIFVRAGGEIFEHKMCSDFVFKLCLKHLSFWEEFQRAHKCAEVFMFSRYSCDILINLEFSRQIFLNNSQISNSIAWEPSWCMLTDRHDGAKSRFSQCCESTKKAKIFFVRALPSGGVLTLYRLLDAQLVVRPPRFSRKHCNARNAIPWNYLHFIWYGMFLYHRATSFKISTFYSYFLVSYISLKQTNRHVPHTHTHTHSYIHIHV